MNNPKDKIQQDLDDVSSVLGPLSMSYAKFDDTYLNDLFDLDVDIEDPKSDEKAKTILQ